MRDRSIDLTKGMAILFIYFAHSILYHPIDMKSLYWWCFYLDKIITSFTLPMFFFVSGYLFSKTNKSLVELYKGKTLRILIPYLTTMIILIVVKLVLPMEMSSNKAVEGGVISMVINALCYGGDRWFVYTLFIIFFLLIPLRKWLNNKWFSSGLIVGLLIIS